MLVGMLKWILWWMRAVMVGKDKIWKGEVNRHLAREKEFKFLAKSRERKLLPQKRAEWNEFIRIYLDGVKYTIEYYWNELDTVAFCCYLNE